MDAHLPAILENTPGPRAMIYGATSRDIWSFPGAWYHRGADVVE